MPKADNTTEAGRALNRRVEISLVTEPDKTPARSELAKDTNEVQRKGTAGFSPAESNIVVTNAAPYKLSGLLNN
jgi:hypothetical protein